eukprot:XP_001690223.1 carbohydrate hydrolase-related protein [Chlamydomonas reinhardtii]
MSASQKCFVQRKGTRLVVGSDSFYFAGANCHYLLTHAANESQRPLVLEVLDDAQRLNLTVLRCWAFCDGPDEWNALQREPGQLCEHVLEGLDWLVEEAGRRGLRLLLVLTNYWPDYGGMPAYVRWEVVTAVTVAYVTHPTSLFYTDPQCQATFRRATGALLARVNRRTGLPYAADPTIMGWELANEPRCEGPGGADMVREFVWSTAEFVKRLAPRQLVTVGLEGFFGASTPGECDHNPYSSASSHGSDFAAVFAHPALDFASIHLYPDQWCPPATPRAELKNFMRSWIRSHAALCGERLNKPLVLSEFGKRDPMTYHGRDCSHHMNRMEAFTEVLDCCMELATAGGPLAGVCAWMLAARQYPDYDGYTLKLGPPSTTPAGAGGARRSCELQAAHAAKGDVAPAPAGEAEWGSGRLDLGRDTGPLRDIQESAQEGAEEEQNDEEEQSHWKDQDQHPGAPPMGTKQGGGRSSCGDSDVRLFGATSGSSTAAQKTAAADGGPQQVPQVLHYSQYIYSGHCNQADEPAVEALQQYGAVMKRLCLLGPSAVAWASGSGEQEAGPKGVSTASGRNGGSWWCGLPTACFGRGRKHPD